MSEQRTIELFCDGEVLTAEKLNRVASTIVDVCSSDVTYHIDANHAKLVKHDTPVISWKKRKMRKSGSYV